MSKWSVGYRVGGAVLGVLGILGVLAGWGMSEVTYTPVTGIAVFAMLYVIAQAVERLVEWVTAGLGLIPDSPGAKKNKAVRELRQANSTLSGNPSDDLILATQGTKSEKEVVVDAKRTDIAFLAHGLSILLAACAVNLLNYGILGSLGASGFDPELDRLLTALAAAGGSKALHEFVQRVQSAKEQAQTSS
jgi:hypothetical protein